MKIVTNSADFRFGPRIAKRNNMRALRFLQVVVMLSFAAASTAAAGPITGQPIMPPVENPAENRQSEEEEQRREAARAGVNDGWLFDDIGPLLRVSAPFYLQLSISSPGGESGGGSGSDSSAASLQEIFADTGAPGVSGSPDLGNLALQLAVSDIPDSDLPALLVPHQAIPEPALGALLLPGLVVLARRYARSRLRR